MVDFLGGRFDEWLIDKRMRKARERAWLMAKVLAKETPEKREEIIANLDREVAAIGDEICNPKGLLTRSGLFFLRLSEPGNVQRVIQRLSN